MTVKILVTGDRGFVGTATKEYLAKQDIEVIGFDLMDRCDIRDKQKLDECVRATKPDRILHLAAVARFAEADADPVLAFETNAVGTRNVSRVASTYHIPVVYASTGSVLMPLNNYPAPFAEDIPARGNSVYGCTKTVGELYIRQCHAPWIILRYAHLYGPEKRMHGAISGFLDRMNRGLQPVLFGGLQSNDFTAIWDVAEANYLALTATADCWKQVYHIGTGEELSTARVFELVKQMTCYNGEIDVKEQRSVDPDRFVFNCMKAEQMLGFKAKYSFEKGLERMLSELKLLKEEARAYGT